MTAPARPRDASSDVLARWEPVIGIEVHCQLRTASKMFCSCSTAYDGAAPNSHVCPVCLGLPGTLPVINRAAVEHVLSTGVAIGATIPARTQWERKNYFYPDLPKGYQISQYAIPLAADGGLTVDTSEGPFKVAIRRAHLEEDTAKLVHAQVGGRRVSLIDFNRSGAPLMEIVTEPVVRTAEQARRYAEELQLLLRAIGASDADMERGQMRVEANVSLRRRGEGAFGTRSEVKNMNSFRAVERAIAFEIERQATTLEAGGHLVQETRGWDDDRGATYRMRVKETSEDYRYFPDPDLPPLTITEAWLATIREGLAELPAARRERYVGLGLTGYDAAVIVGDVDAQALLEALVEGGVPAVAAARWVTGEYLRLRKTQEARDVFDAARLAPHLAELIRLQLDDAITLTNAKETFETHIATGQPIAAIVAERGYRKISDTSVLDRLVDEALAENPAAVADVGAGKLQAIGFLVGQVMKASKGQANAALVQAAIRERIQTG